MESDKTKPRILTTVLHFLKSMSKKCNVDNPSMLAKTRPANLENVRKET